MFAVFNGSSRKKGAFTVLSLACLLLAGCAVPRSRLPGVEATPGEREWALAAVEKLLERRSACRCCLEAEVELTITAEALLPGRRSWTMTGYLQAMAPGYLKFFGINPLGQPVLILAVDGREFTTVLVPEGKAYQGPVGAGAFRKYAPAGFDPENSYAWLTGQPDESRVTAVRREEGGGYWLQLSAENGRELLLLSRIAGVIRERRLVDDRGNVVLRVVYGHYRRVNGCLLPGEFMLIVTGGNTYRVKVVLVEPVLDAPLSERGFTVSVPAGYETERLR